MNCIDSLKSNGFRSKTDDVVKDVVEDMVKNNVDQIFLISRIVFSSCAKSRTSQTHQELQVALGRYCRCCCTTA